MKNKIIIHIHIFCIQTSNIKIYLKGLIENIILSAFILDYCIITKNCQVV